MCRLAGIIDFASPPSSELITRMRDIQKHGGPDDSGLYMDEDFPLAFGFRRLSLQDLSIRGHQPMLDRSKKVVLIFNGEIYNFHELRQELEKLGHSFESSSDTEVIISSYLQWGVECFRRFNGMFALALLDKRVNRLILARDHAGIKPLYYSISGNSLYFASEVKAFKEAKPTWPENEKWKKLFLMFGHLPEPVTTLKDVQPLPSGTFMEIELPSMKATSRKYFTLYYNYTISDKDEAIEKIRLSLTAAVSRHLISDAPIGLFLSGGLDSGLLTILASKFIPQNLKTVSVVFEDERYSEKYYQDIIIKETNAGHASFLVTENEFRESLSDILKAMDQPSNDGINSYFVSKYARSIGLKAALSGLGADELFGGYKSFNRSRWINSFKGLPEFMYKVAGVVLDAKKKKLSFLNLNSGLGDYLSNRGFFIPLEVAQLLDCTESEVEEDLSTLNKQFPLFVEKLPPKERISYLEMRLYMQNQLLKDMDYMSMWHGLEVRVPFLDKALMEVLYSINPDIRYHPSQIKYLLIEAFRRDIPAEIWKREKKGFELPFEHWMKDLNSYAPSTSKGREMQGNFRRGKVHWSKYWSYVLSEGGISRA